ncbi:uncharacterized protein METZ01_LOCUS177840, partial [marine metagenome]
FLYFYYYLLHNYFLNESLTRSIEGKNGK